MPTDPSLGRVRLLFEPARLGQARMVRGMKRNAERILRVISLLVLPGLALWGFFTLDGGGGSLRYVFLSFVAMGLSQAVSPKERTRSRKGDPWLQPPDKWRMARMFLADALMTGACLGLAASVLAWGRPVLAGLMVINAIAVAGCSVWQFRQSRAAATAAEDMAGGTVCPGTCGARQTD